MSSTSRHKRRRAKGHLYVQHMELLIHTTRPPSLAERNNLWPPNTHTDGYRSLLHSVLHALMVFILFFFFATQHQDSPALPSQSHPTPAQIPRRQTRSLLCTAWRSHIWTIRRFFGNRKTLSLYQGRLTSPLLAQIFLSFLWPSFMEEHRIVNSKKINIEGAFSDRFFGVGMFVKSSSFRSSHHVPFVLRASFLECSCFKKCIAHSRVSSSFNHPWLRPRHRVSWSALSA